MCSRPVLNRCAHGHRSTEISNGRSGGAASESPKASAWSPEQIANRLPIGFPTDSPIRISHEAIHQSCYIEDRGRLERESVACLRTGRALCKPGARVNKLRIGFITDDETIAPDLPKSRTGPQRVTGRATSSSFSTGPRPARWSKGPVGSPRSGTCRPNRFTGSGPWSRTGRRCPGTDPNRCVTPWPRRCGRYPIISASR